MLFKSKNLLIIVFILVLSAYSIIYSVEKFIAAEVYELLDDEAKQACEDCRFTAEKLSVSLLTFSAQAKNAAIRKNGTPYLSFKKIKLIVGLQKILNKHVILERLDLIDGYTEGIGIYSPTFDFIDQLTSGPPENESDAQEAKDPDWSVRLNELRVINLDGNQKFLGQQVDFHNIAVKLYRDEKDEFKLEPSVEKITLVNPYQPNLLLAHGEGDIYFYEKLNLVQLKPFQLKNKNSRATINTDFLPNNDIKGELAAYLHSKEFLPENYDFKLQVDSDYIYSNNNLKLSATAEIDQKQNNSLEILGNDYQLKNLSSSWLYQFSQDESLIALEKFNLSGNKISASLTKQLTWANKLDGELTIKLKELNLPEAQLKDIVIKLNPEGDSEDPRFKLSGTVHQLILKQNKFKSLNFEISDITSLDQIKIWHDSIELGKLSANIALQNLSPTRVTANFVNYKFQPDGIDYLNYLVVDGKVNFSNVGDWQGDGTLQLSSRYFSDESSLNIKFSLSSKELSLKLQNKSDSISGVFNYDLTKDIAKLNLDLKSFQLKEYNPNIRCSNISLNLDYQFAPDNYLSGDGVIRLGEAAIGCKTYEIKTEAASSYSIKAGKIDPLNVSLFSNKNKLDINGYLNLNGDGLLKTTGEINLNSFLPAFYFLDEIRGSLNVDTTLELISYQPKVTGDVTLRDLDFFSSQFDLIGSGFSGQLLIDHNQLTASDVSGLINNAPLEINSEYDLNNPDSAKLNLKFSKLDINPVKHSNLTLSGELVYQYLEEKPLLSGSVYVDEAIYARDFGVNNISSLISSIFSTSNSNSYTEQSLPKIPVDINLEARRNLFILTDLLEAELGAQFKITGNLNELEIKGIIDSLYGTLGLSNSKFEIAKAEVLFDPEYQYPLLSIQAGTTVYDRFGEAIYINLLADGNTNNFDIDLSTDNNLSEQQILTLLTTRGQFTTGTGANRNQKSLFKNKINDNTFDNLVDKLTTLDSIRIEPAYSQRTGLIEPSIIAEKYLSEDLTLSSQSFISGNTNDTKFIADYQVNPFFGFSGLIDTGSASGNTALEANVSLNAIKNEYLTVDYQFDNRSSFSNREILSMLLLNRKSILLKDDLVLLENKLANILKDKGYHHPNIDIICLEYQDYCKQLEFIIPDLEISQIKNILLTKNPPAGVKLDYRSYINKKAARETLDKICFETTLEFRNQGYLSAIVKCNYFENDQNEKVVGIQFDSGKAISLLFEGNKVFSKAELVEKLELLSSRFPITRNSINRIAGNLEKIYREAGYLLAEIKLDKIIQGANRTSYQIKIIENKAVTISPTEIAGLSREQKETLKNYLAKNSPSTYQTIFKPKKVIEEQIKNSILEINRYFINLGYTDIKTGYRIIAVNDQQFKLKLDIQLGNKSTVTIAAINSGQEIVHFDDLIGKEIALSKVNQISKQISNQLKNAGFIDFNIETTQTSEQVSYQINELQSYHIASINCTGNQSISCQQIIRLSKLQPKQIISTKSLSKARSNLYRSNLFNDITIEIEDLGKNNYQKNIVINTTENNLRSLSFGLGLNSELGFHIFSEAADYKIFRDGRSISLRLDSYIDEVTNEVNQGIASLRYKDPDLFNNDFSYNSELSIQKYDNPTLEFDLDRVSLDNSILKSWDNRLTTTFGITVFEENLDNVTPGAILSELDIGKVNLSYLYGNFNYDIGGKLDLRVSVDYKIASETILSDANFYSLGSKLSALYNVRNSNWSFANLVNFSRSFTYNGTTEVPISQRYYLGGRNTVRGFRENSLGPRADSDNAIIGGETLFSNNFEIRYKLDEDFQINSFFDVGNVYLDKFNFSSEMLRESAGLGFRYLSPIGPIGLDVGFPLDREDGESPYRIHFAVGSNF